MDAVPGKQSDGGQRIVNMAVGGRGKGKGRGVEGMKGGRAVKDKGGQMIYMQNKSQKLYHEEEEEKPKKEEKQQNARRRSMT